MDGLVWAGNRGDGTDIYVSPQEIYTHSHTELLLKIRDKSKKKKKQLLQPQDKIQDQGKYKVYVQEK